VERVLYQFPVSHYCEKVRWVLDHKGVPYRIHNQLPGLHARTNKRRSGSPTVPLLVEGGRAISGSHAIALHLETCSPERRLIPASEAARARLAETVGYFDEVVGMLVIRYLYGLITPRVGLFREVFFSEYRGLAKLLGHLFARPLTHAIASLYKIRSEDAHDLPDQIRRVADRVERELPDGSRFLIGDDLSLADITVASLLGPIVGPVGSPWAFELQLPEFQALRAELRARPAGQYVVDQYSRRHQLPARARRPDDRR
jgi:glutathione S-transferase